MPQIDIKLKSAADTSGFDKTKQAAAGVGTALKGAAGGVGDMTQKLSEAEIKAGAGKDVIEGLSYAAKGGEGAFFGLTKAAGAFFAVLNASPVMMLVSAVGLLLAGMKLLLDKVVESSTAWERMGKTMKPISEAYKEIDDAAKASLDDQLKRLNEIITAYEDWEKAASRARKEADKMNDAQQRLELAKIDNEEAGALGSAQTQEQRDAIKKQYEQKRTDVRQRYEDAKLENERLDATAKIRESEEQLRKIQTERDRLDADIREKQAAFDSAMSKSDYALRSGKSGDVVQEQMRESQKAKRALDDAKQSKAKWEETARKEERKAYDEAREARATLDVNKVDSETIKQTRQTKSKQQDAERAPSKDEIDALGKEAEEAAARGDWAAQDAAVAKRRALLSAGKKPSPVATYAPTDKASSTSQPGQLPDLATPLRDAAQKAGDSATQSADSIQAAADAAKAVADNTKPLDASALTSALQAAATAQQTASTQTATGMQQLVSLGQQQVTIAQQQASEMAKLRSQVENLRQRLNQLAQRAA